MTPLRPAAEPLDGRDVRWQEHRAQRRRELVEDTLRAIRQHGPGIGMDDIAAAAGTSKTVLYRHFGDRTGIYLAVAEAVDEVVLTDLGAVADPSGRGPDGELAQVTEVISAMVRAYLRLVERDPEIYRFVVTRPLLARSPAGQQPPDPVLTLTSRIGDELAGILTAHLLRAGRDPAPAVTWAHGIVGFVRAAADHWVSHPADSTAEDVTAAVVALLHPALTPPAREHTQEDRMTLIARTDTLTDYPVRGTEQEEISPLGRSLRVATGGRWLAVRDHARATLPAALMVRDPGMTTAQARDWVRWGLGELVAHGYATTGYPREYGGQDDIGRGVVEFELTAHGDLSLTVKSGVQFGLFGGAVLSLGTRWHHDRFLRDIMSVELPGSYAMTEIGHGSDVASLQTTLTFDPATEEIVVHSPSPSAMKAYIGGAAQDARMAVVYGQLWVGEDCHGVHAALVPIRDESGATLPGVTAGDHGPKGGLAGVDNGTLLFDQVRVPREMLLNRYGGVGEDGVYTSPIDSANRRFFVMLGTLVRGRISIAAAGEVAGRKALSIATRYAVRRRQFTAPGHEGDVPLLDYLAHQRKLLPAIATAYALMFAQNEIIERLEDLHQAPEKDQEAQRELETRAAGIKAMATRWANDTAQVCREACGGAGYLAENGLTTLRHDADVFATFEGDNTVLLQLVAKGLLTGYKEMFGDLDMLGMVQFAARSFGGAVIERTAARPLITRLIDAANRRSEEDTLLDRGWHLGMFEDRERHVLETLAGRMRSANKAGQDSFTAFNGVQDHVLLAARTHMDRVILEAFVAGIDACTDPDAKDRLQRMCDLYCLTSLEADAGWFLEHGRMSPARSKAVTAAVAELCGLLRPDAIALVEGMGIPEAWLGSSMLAQPQWTS